jgi:ankyrin repeat protein
MKRPLPSRPNLDQLKHQAKDLLQAHRSGDREAIRRIQERHPRWMRSSAAEVAAAHFTLSSAQLVVAREYGFASWPKLKEHVETAAPQAGDAFAQFQKAFRADDAEGVRQILDENGALKARINEPWGPFDSPAIVNARSGRMLDVLLAAGADLNAKSRWWAGGFGLLHSASPEVAAHAIARGAVVDTHAAARLGMLEQLRALLATEPALVHARGGDGQTPLHFAASVEVAEFLLDNGADIDARDIDHESTPAQYMLADRQDVARFLVRRGCKTDLLMAVALGDAALARLHLDTDPECIRLRVTPEFFPMIGPSAGGTIYQWTLGFFASAHQVARKFGHETLLSLLLDRSPADVQLLAACWLGDTATVQALTAADPGLAGRLTESDRRQVADAARNNETAVVRLMLAAGLPVDARGQHGATPLHWAAFHGNAEMAEVVLSFGPPLEARDADYGGPPVGWAIHGSEHGWVPQAGNYADTLEALLRAGARLPENAAGSEVVREVLRRHGVQETA